MGDFSAEVTAVPRPNGVNQVVNGTFESDTAGWESNSIGGTSGVATLTRSTARQHTGTASMLVTWPTSASGSIVDYPGLVPGTSPWGQHTYSAWVYVPAGSPDVLLTIRNGRLLASGRQFSSATITAKDTWTLAGLSFLYAGIGDAAVCVESAGPTTAGGQCFVDDVDMHALAVPYLMLMADGADTACPAVTAENLNLAYGARVQATNRSPQLPLVTSVLRYVP